MDEHPAGHELLGPQRYDFDGNFFYEAPPPPLHLVATTTWLRPTCLVLWHGGAWGGLVPVFVTETQARPSIAFEVIRFVERGLN